MSSARTPWWRTPATLAPAVLLAALLPSTPALAAPGGTVVIPAAGLEVHHLALSAGVLAVAGSASPTGTDTVHTYAADGTAAAAAGDGAGTASTMPIARTGIRVARTEPGTDGRYDVVIDDLATTQVRIPGALAAADALQLSGPYTLAGPTAYGASGAVLAVTDAGLAATLDGQRLVWAAADGTVRVRDLQLPAGGRNPRVIASTGCAAPCVLSLAAAGDTVALARSDAAAIDLLDLTGAALGTIATGSVPSGLLASTSAVAWTEGDTLRFSPLGTPVATTLATVSTAVAPVLDDDVAAWVDPAGDVELAPLPGVGPGPAQLLGSTARPAFSPNADTAGDEWRLPIWSSKPLSDARITLTSLNGDQYGPSTTTGQGTELTLAWDGTTPSSTRVPDGVYTWTLDAVALDGTGPVLAADGTQPTGLVTVASHSPAPYAAPPASSTGNAVRGAWGLAAPRFGITAAYDVRVRQLKVAPGGVRIPSTLAGRTVLSATRATSAALLAGQPSGSVWQVSVRATDSAGNSTTWSPWRTTTVA